MSSKTEICNIALGHIGVGKSIADFETEQSASATACRRFYDIALKQVLRDANWSFATKIEALALIESNPNDEWDYSYRYPSKAVRLRRILSGIRNDTRQSRVPYKVAFDDSARIIYTDSYQAVIEYTYLVDDPTYYPSDFLMAFSYYLASLLAPQLTGGDPFNLGDKNKQLYMQAMQMASVNNFNEQQDEVEVDSEFIRTRE